MTIGTDVDKRKSTKASKIGHMRISIPKEVREIIEITSKDFIEWVVDTNKNTLTGKLVKNDLKPKLI